MVYKGGNAMSTPSLTDKQLQDTIDAYNKTGTKTEAALLLNLNSTTYAHRFRTAVAKGFKPSEKKEESLIDKLKDANDRIRQLESASQAQEEEKLTAEYIKKKIIKLGMVSPPFPIGW